MALYGRRIWPFQRIRNMALHLSRVCPSPLPSCYGWHQRSHDPRLSHPICRGYCTNYNKPKTTLTRAEKVTILNHGIGTNSECTYCIFSKSFETNMRVTGIRRKVFFACFSMDAGAVRILLSSDKECTYVCFRGIKNASPYIYIGIKAAMIRKSSLFVPPPCSSMTDGRQFHPCMRLMRFRAPICNTLPPCGKFATEDGK